MPRRWKIQIGRQRSRADDYKFVCVNLTSNPSHVCGLCDAHKSFAKIQQQSKQLAKLLFARERGPRIMQQPATNQHTKLFLALCTESFDGINVQFTLASSSFLSVIYKLSFPSANGLLKMCADLLNSTTRLQWVVFTFWQRPIETSEIIQTVYDGSGGALAARTVNRTSVLDRRGRSLMVVNSSTLYHRATTKTRLVTSEKLRLVKIYEDVDNFVI